jgi:hypothetical protein
MSAIGQERTLVGFVGGMVCPLMTQSGHRGGAKVKRLADYGLTATSGDYSTRSCKDAFTLAAIIGILQVWTDYRLSWVVGTIRDIPELHYRAFSRGTNVQFGTKSSGVRTTTAAAYHRNVVGWRTRVVCWWHHRCCSRGVHLRYLAES